MMNLAPLRYRHVLSRFGGPIRSTECAMTTVMGRPVFQANAYLNEGLRPITRSNVMFGNPDGSGTAQQVSVARYKAVSEALERWAHDTVYNSPERSRYGFDVDPSSNGMAAFPGMFARQARSRALGEAAERFALIGWWSGAVDAAYHGEVWPGVTAYRLENPVSDHVIVLLHADADEGVHAYGHGAGNSMDDACLHAAVELSRSQYVLRRHVRRQQGPGAPAIRNMLERRCLYFSTEDGHAEFLERMGRRKWRSVEPKVVFDGRIDGPWQEYACVWRVVFEPPSTAFLDPKENFFYW